MFLKLLFFIILPINTYALIIDIKSDNIKYHLEVNDKTIRLLGNLVNISISNTKCSKDFINQFTTELNENLETSKSFIKYINKSIIIDSNNKSYYLPNHTIIANYFRSIPNELIQLKLQNKYLCNK